MVDIEEKIPKILQRGLQEYASKNAFSAVKIWMMGSANSEPFLVQDKAKMLIEIEYAYGFFRRHTVKDIQDITNTIRLIFLTFHYEKGEISARFLAYKQSKHWILANFIFSTALQTTKAFLL